MINHNHHHQISKTCCVSKTSRANSISENVSHRQDKANQQLIKHTFLKKNSRQFLASSRPKAGLKNVQSNQFSLNTPISKNDYSIRSNSWSRSENLNSKEIKNNPNQVNLVQRHKNFEKNKTQTLCESVQDSFESILKDRDILCPPISKMHAQQLYKKASHLNRSHTQNISSIYRKSQQNFSIRPKQSNQNINDLNNFSQIHANKTGDFTKKLKQKANISFLQKQNIQICPQLFCLYKSQHLIDQCSWKGFKIRLYSKGRKQIKYGDGTIQVYYNNGNEIKLTRWINGDFKLIEGDKVSYWSEQLNDLDQYFLN